MIKRPLNERFSDAVREGRKVTTIRDKPWPIGVPIMLYNWSGKPYRSPQIDVAAVEVIRTEPIVIERIGDLMAYHYSWLILGIQPLWQAEGFHYGEDMDEWFRAKLKPGQKVEKHLMLFGLMEGGGA